MEFLESAMNRERSDAAVKALAEALSHDGVRKVVNSKLDKNFAPLDPDAFDELGTRLHAFLDMVGRQIGHGAS